MAQQYWIFKTEPSTYSIDDLKREKVTEWYGIRNYQVRNFIRDTMKKGDDVLIYHSNNKEIGIVGLAKVVSESYSDTKQWKPRSPYYDPKSKKTNPTWLSRDVAFAEKFPRIVTLGELKGQPELKNLLLLRKGNRLSITPLSKQEFRLLLTLARKS